MAAKKVKTAGRKKYPKWMADFHLDLLMRKEKLLPELTAYVVVEQMYGKRMKVLRHPLLITDLDDVNPIPNTMNKNAYANAIYLERKKVIEKARAEKDWDSFVMMHERPYRVTALAVIADQLADQEYWELLGCVYTDSENIFRQKRLVTKLLRSTRSQRLCIMSKSEQNMLKAMPGKLTIYRGCQNSTNSKQGWSWTLDEARANWFAVRFGFDRQPLVLTATAEKKHVIAYFNGRKEKEIVINPKYAKVIEEAEAKTPKDKDHVGIF